MRVLDPIVRQMTRSFPRSNWICRFKDMEIMYGKPKTKRDLHFPIHPPATYQKEGKKFIPSNVKSLTDVFKLKKTGNLSKNNRRLDDNVRK